jgi:hypothetical protein
MIRDVLSLTTFEREELESRCRSRRLRAEDARRARLVLMLAKGESYAAVQAALGCDPGYVSRWKKRFEAERLAGLYSRHQGSKARVLTAGTPNPFSLPLQVNLYNAFSGSYDPVLAANTGGGVNPGWMYAAGVAYATPTPQNPDPNDLLFLS